MRPSLSRCPSPSSLRIFDSISSLEPASVAAGPPCHACRYRRILAHPAIRRRLGGSYDCSAEPDTSRRTCQRSVALFFRCSVGDNPHDLKSLRRILLTELCQSGHLQFARTAPCRPEVYKQRFASIVGERDWLSIESGNEECRCTFTDETRNICHDGWVLGAVAAMPGTGTRIAKRGQIETIARLILRRASQKRCI